jgi:hypothetical protein
MYKKFSRIIMILILGWVSSGCQPTAQIEANETPLAEQNGTVSFSAIPSLSQSADTTDIQICQADVDAGIEMLLIIVDAIERYRETESFYPTDLSDLVPDFFQEYSTTEGGCRYYYNQLKGGDGYTLGFVIQRSNFGTWARICNYENYETPIWDCEADSGELAYHVGYCQEIQDIPAGLEVVSELIGILQMHKDANGTYPREIAELVPEYIEQLPETEGGCPLIYEYDDLSDNYALGFNIFQGTIAGYNKTFVAIYRNGMLGTAIMDRGSGTR